MALIQRLIKSSKDQYIIPESLTHSSGTISAIINGVTYTCTLSGLTANTLYFLYLRSGQANIQFVITAPSSYRVTYPDAILIGAFYSDGMSPVAFGSFVTIEGSPQTDWIKFLSTKTNFTTGAENCQWKRLGDSVEYKIFFALNGAPTGTLYFTAPSGQTPNGAKFDFSANDGHVGQVTLNDSAPSANYHGHVQPSNLTGTFRVVNSSGQNEWDASIPTALNNGDRFSGVINLLPIVGFSNLPLKDL